MCRNEWSAKRQPMSCLWLSESHILALTSPQLRLRGDASIVPVTVADAWQPVIVAEEPFEQAERQMRARAPCFFLPMRGQHVKTMTALALSSE